MERIDTANSITTTAMIICAPIARDAEARVAAVEMGSTAGEAGSVGEPRFDLRGAGGLSVICAIVFTVFEFHEAVANPLRRGEKGCEGEEDASTIDALTITTVILNIRLDFHKLKG
ncbi:hypothetical protein Q3G72_019835 [Acer saccharum]|nr:hypothetical protein Q3G72_019835 [Acer saccharum]